MAKINIDTLNEERVDLAIDGCVSATIWEIANDKNIFDDWKDNRFRVGELCAEKVETVLGCELDEESFDWLVHVTYQAMRDYGYYTSPKARKLLIRECYEGSRAILDSRRWEEIIDILWQYGYFENVSVNNVLDGRGDYGYSGFSLKNHGVTIGWNAGSGTLVNGWSRMGIDSNWNKVGDAIVLLYWPGVDEMGKRRWERLLERLDGILDPKSKIHRKFVKNHRSCEEFAFDMSPTYGKDA